MKSYLFTPSKKDVLQHPKICLNMIVKNESAIIERLLNSVLPLIDAYCICDTGSTDNTIVLIRRFFQEHNLPGKLVEEPFRDFAYNRNYARKQSAGLVSETDYLLLVDADMVLEMPPGFSPLELKESLTDDAYSMFQGSDTFCYKNVRLLKNNPMFSYWGVTHEFVQLLPESKTTLLEKSTLFLRDVGDGGSKQDKFERDIRLLEKGLKENPKNERYTFYLANSLRDAGKPKDAIEVYLRRIELGGWIEELWFSYYSIGQCYQRMGKMPEAVFYWLEGFHLYPDRLENVYQIIHYYREQSKYPIAYTFYSMARNSTGYSKRTEDHLFYEKDIYDYKLEYELSIIGYYCNWYQYDLVAANRAVMEADTTTESIRKNVLSNYKFYAPDIESWTNVDQTIDFLNMDREGIAAAPDAGPDFVHSTPSIVFDRKRKIMWLSVRYVNYRLSPTCSAYKLKNTIATKNRILRFSCDGGVFQKTADFWLQYDMSHDAYYCGIEDVRLFVDDKGTVHFNGNRVLKSGEIVIEHGIIDAERECTVSELVRKKTDRRKVEKNWVFFGHENQVVYEWFPFTIGEYRRQPNGELLLEIVAKKKTPALLQSVRGSCHGVPIGEETWFLCHTVSYETKSFYYHLWVVVDTATQEIKRVSSYFTFGKGKHVEYTLGCLYLEEDEIFLIGFSQLDCETRFLTVGRNKFDGLF